MGAKGKKKMTQKLVRVPKSVQDTIPISRIARDGIFELENKPGLHQFDRVYLFYDINFTTQDEDEKERTDKKYQQILNSLNVSFKVIVSNHYSDNANLVDDIIQRASADEMIPLVQDYREIFMRRAQKSRDGLQKTKYFVISCCRDDFSSAETFFDTLESSLSVLFRKIGSGLIPLNATERLRALHSFYRMGQEDTFSFNWNDYLELKRDWRNDIINTSILEKKEYLEFEENRYACTMFVRNFPSEISDTFVKEITNVPFPLICTIDCEPIDRTDAYDMTMNRFMNNQRSMEREQANKNDNGLYSTPVSYEKRMKQEQLESTLDSLRSYNENMFFVGITFLFQADSEGQLAQRKEKIIQIGKSYNMEIAVCSWQQLDSMNTTLPIGVRFVDHMRSMNTPSLSMFTPFDIQEINDQDGLCYGINQVSKNFILGNRKTMHPNGNGVVFGATGSGKSFDEKMEMGQVMSFTEDNIIVVDPMGEYRTVADKYNGAYINLSRIDRKAQTFNPFHVHGDIPQRRKFYEEKAEFAFAICELALKPEPLTNRHVAIIDRAVQSMYDQYFALRDSKNTQSAKDRVPSPTIRELREEIAKESEENKLAEQLAGDLEVFAEGTLNVFSHQQSEQTQNRFVCYGFDGIGKRLRPMALLIMIESITNQIKYNQDNDIPTWVYIDEIHELWDNEYSLQAIERLWREVRKRGGICTGMSQNIIDGLQNRSTKVMISNSAFKCLLDQGDCDQETLKDLFHLSDQQMTYVVNAEKGTGLIQFGSKIIPFDNRVEKDCSLYDVYNTDFHEIIEEKRKSHEKNEKATS